MVIWVFIIDTPRSNVGMRFGLFRDWVCPSVMLILRGIRDTGDTLVGSTISVKGFLK